MSDAQYSEDEDLAMQATILFTQWQTKKSLFKKKLTINFENPLFQYT